MKRIEWAGLCAVVALFAGSPKAQQTSAPVANPVTATVKSQLPRFAKNMVEAAQAMPAEKYSFKPTPKAASERSSTRNDRRDCRRSRS